VADTVDIAGIRRANGWSPIRSELGVGAFGINAWHGDAGAQLIGEHTEERTGHEELYVVVAGTARFTVDGEETVAATGTVVFVRDPASTRAAVADADGTTVLSVGGNPTEAYRPLPWEVNAQVFDLFGRGEIREAKELVTGALDRFEDRSALLYNLACAEARLGEVEAAFTHLQAAVDDRETLAALARDDSDFEALRDDPRFAALTA
jgi:quercetin dioxygenase-like cupin family protein